MRSIIEKRDEHKEKKYVRWLLIFMLSLLVLSSLGYSFLSNPDADSPVTTGQQDQYGRWMETVQGQPLPFSYSRAQVRHIPVAVNLTLQEYYQKDVYVAGENSAGLQAEITPNFGLYIKRLQEVCLHSCERDLPEKTCSDLVIYWNASSSEKKVWQEEYCVFIEGGLESVDAFLYSIL